MFAIFLDSVGTLIQNCGFTSLSFGQALMILVSFVLMYLAIGRGFEPLLLLPIAFGMFLTNIPNANLYHTLIFINETGHIDWSLLAETGGLLDYLYLGVKLGIYPPLIFLGVGCMTDFGPLIANPKSFLMGAAAQLGIFLAFFGALCIGFTPAEAGSIGIIGASGTGIQELTTIIDRLGEGVTNAIGIGGRDLNDNTACPASPWFDRGCGIFLYGACPDHPAADHEGADHQRRAYDQDGAAPSGFQDREADFPGPGYDGRFLPGSGYHPADRYAHAGQPV